MKPLSSHLVEVAINIDNKAVSVLRNESFHIYGKNVSVPGLPNIPRTYIEKNYKREIDEGLKHFLYRYLVIDYLTEELFNKKIHLANFPRLDRIELGKEQTSYIFNISTANRIALREWKHFVFKAPRRKNYKDLDKQVDLFIKLQQEKAKKASLDTVEENDWVYFNAQLLKEEDEPLLPNYSNNFWIKVSMEPPLRPFPASFIGNKLGNIFITNKLSLNEGGTAIMPEQYSFLITIKAIAKGSYLTLDTFKSGYRLPNKAALHEKIIEVFSYRNDISQRRSIIEEMFHLFFSKHRFEIPKHLIIRKQSEILSSLKDRPDFQAYRKQPDFMKHVTMLAEKQLKEEILIDQIASFEKIKVEMKDITHYLNVLSNERAKEFIYFRSVFDQVKDTSSPYQASLIKQTCRREKTLNYILHQLTR